MIAYSRSLSISFHRGLWNVPFISGVYLINGSLLQDEDTKPSYINNLLDADMAFCLNNRNNGIFMHISNRVDWGHLVFINKLLTVMMEIELCFLI